MHYDLVIIGGGPAGYNASERAAEAGLKVLVAEKRAFGGVCLNEGCIPSKCFLSSSKRYSYASDSKKFGISSEVSAYDQKTVVKRKNKVVKRLVAGVEAAVKNAGAIAYKEEAVVLGKEGTGFKIQVGEEVVTCDKLLICSGSEAAVPPITGLKEGLEAGWVVTNRGILDQESLPERFVIIGGGVIGLEMASYFQTLGVKTEVVEMLDHIAGATDTEISNGLLEEFTKMGVKFHLGARVTAFKDHEVVFELDGKEESIQADLCLLSIGRRAVTRGFGLETLDILDERGRLTVNEKMETACPGVYAAGDVTGLYMLAHVADREGEVAINNILGKEDYMEYTAIPSVIYGHPESASCGMTEEELQAAGRTYRKLALPMSYSGRFQAETERETGIAKLLVEGEGDDGIVVGAHLLCPYASEIILSTVFAISAKLRLKDVKKMIFPHPTIGEVMREAIFKHE